MTPRISARRIGHEGEPVVIVDYFVADPHALRRFAATARFTRAGDHYPGVRAPLPDGFFAPLSALLATVFGDAFGLRGRARVLDAGFAIVTTPPSDLTLAQRLPHVDATDPRRLALVHYLGPDELGGTAFYRHRATGFETISEARSAAYFAALRQDIARFPPEGYIAGSTPLFERIDLVEPRFNRAVFYRSHLLHSGAIAPDAALTGDSANGRLTITGFFAAD